MLLMNLEKKFSCKGTVNKRTNNKLREKKDDLQNTTQIEQHEPHKHSVWTHVFMKGVQVLHWLYFLLLIDYNDEIYFCFFKWLSLRHRHIRVSLFRCMQIVDKYSICSFLCSGV